MRATTTPPPWPGRTCSSWIGFATHSSVFSLGNWNSGGMMPMTCLMLSETKNDLPMIAESPPNQECHNRWLMRTTSSLSSGWGSRPSSGWTPSTRYISLVAKAIPMRSTRSGVRRVEVPPPQVNMPSMSREFCR